MSRKTKIFRRVVGFIFFIMAIFVYPLVPEKGIAVILMCVTFAIAVILFGLPWEYFGTKLVVSLATAINVLLVFCAYTAGWTWSYGQWWYYLIPSVVLILLMIGQSIYQRTPPRIRELRLTNTSDWERHFYTPYDRCTPRCSCGRRTTSVELREKDDIRRRRAGNYADPLSHPLVFACHSCDRFYVEDS